MAVKMAVVVCANCVKLWRSVLPQHPRLNQFLGKLEIRRNLCSISPEDEVTFEQKLQTSSSPPAHLLQSKGMGTPIAETYRPVHPEVAEILTNSKPQFVRGNWRKPKISARRLAESRKQYIARGFFWPEKPMVDRGLDRTPKGHKYERLKEERLRNIEENMKNVPNIVEEYRKKMRDLRAKRREEKLASKMRLLEAQKKGVNLKDPRALQALTDKKGSKKKK